MSGYNFYVERDGDPIAQSEWDALVAARADLTLNSEYPTGTVAAGRRGDDMENGFVEWFEPGSIIVRMDWVDGDELNDMIALADQFGSRLVGEGGEIYHEDGTVEG